MFTLTHTYAYTRFLHEIKGTDVRNLQVNAQNLLLRSRYQMKMTLEHKDKMLSLLPNEPKVVVNEAIAIIELFGNSHGNLSYDISSPNYPHDYPSLANYAWLIRTNGADQQVHFKLKDLNIEKCCDQLAIYDGSSRTGGRLLAVISGVNKTSHRRVFLSTRKALFIRLTSDCSVNGKGFSGRVRSISYTPPPTTLAVTTTNATTRGASTVATSTTATSTAATSITAISAIPAPTTAATTTKLLTEATAKLAATTTAEVIDILKCVKNYHRVSVPFHFVRVTFPGNPTGNCNEWLVTAQTANQSIMMHVVDVNIRPPLYVIDPATGRTLAEFSCYVWNAKAGSLGRMCSGRKMTFNQKPAPGNGGRVTILLRIGRIRRGRQPYRGFELMFQQLSGPELAHQQSPPGYSLYVSDDLALEQTCNGVMFDAELQPEGDLGGGLGGKELYIKTPGLWSGADYPNNTYCWWTVTVSKSSNTIYASVSSYRLWTPFTLEKDKDFLRFYQGVSHSPLPEEEEYVNTYKTNADRIHAEFYSNADVSFPGFTIRIVTSLLT